jgi:hypothetical protein
MTKSIYEVRHLEWKLSLEFWLYISIDIVTKIESSKLDFSCSFMSPFDTNLFLLFSYSPFRASAICDELIYVRSELNSDKTISYLFFDFDNARILFHDPFYTNTFVSSDHNVLNALHSAVFPLVGNILTKICS